MTSIYVDMDRRDHDPCPEAGTATASWGAMVLVLSAVPTTNFAVWLRTVRREKMLFHTNETDGGSPGWMELE
jgi:hypothetical protein